MRHATATELNPALRRLATVETCGASRTLSCPVTMNRAFEREVAVPERDL